MGQKISAIIIDDEDDSIFLISNLLDKYCKNIEVIGIAENVSDGISCIEDGEPDLVFLDINLPDGDGFDVLNQVKYKQFEVIFVTAYNDYAIKAFEFSAIHYLLKPINYKDLIEAVYRYENSKKSIDQTSQYEVLNESIKEKFTKIILPTTDGISIIELKDIMRCESQNNYTTFYLNNKEKFTVSKSISTYETLLCDLDFSRVHSKHIVNLHYIKKYIRGRGGYIILSDGTTVYVSEGKKKEFLKKLNTIARG